jgi:hypothetical protein
MVVVAIPRSREFVSRESSFTCPASEAEDPRIDFLLGRRNSGVRSASGIEERLR